MKNFILLIILSCINVQIFGQDKTSTSNSNYETLLLKTFQEVDLIENIKNKTMKLDKNATRSEMIKATCQVKELSLIQISIIDRLFNYPKVENETYQKEVQLRKTKEIIEETLRTLDEKYYKGRLDETCKREG